MKEQGAGRACKDDWALLPETERHPEGLSWGAKCLRMVCLWLMGRAMTSVTMKIVLFLPKRSKKSVLNTKNQNQSKNLQKQSNGHPKNQKKMTFFQKMARGHNFKKFSQLKTSFATRNSISKPLLSAQNLLKNQKFLKK